MIICVGGLGQCYFAQPGRQEDQTRSSLGESVVRAVKNIENEFVTGAAQGIHKVAEHGATSEIQQSWNVFHRHDIRRGLDNQASEVLKKLPVRVVIFLIVRGERLAGSATDQDGVRLLYKQLLECGAGERCDILAQKRRADVRLIGVSAGFIGINTGDNVETFFTKAVGQTARAAEQIDD